ncbi:hypothetical protein, partial [Limnohabitans curvus]|uniref:hypothetical protein n=1 Tax=Limnohabitans curvus TaxID=323423 RepID=UPI001B866AAB
MSIFPLFQNSDQRRSFYSFLTLATFSFLSACGGSSQFNDRTYAIGGYISGLNAGQQVILVNNASDTLTVAADGSFLFNKTVAFNGSYNITVGTQPTGQVCSVANNSGSGAGVTANVTSVSIVCAT